MLSVKVQNDYNIEIYAMGKLDFMRSEYCVAEEFNQLYINLYIIKSSLPRSKKEVIFSRHE